MAKPKQDWQDAQRRCGLSDEEVRMAQALGFRPHSLITNIPSKSQPWKASVPEWIRDLYARRFGGLGHADNPAAVQHPSADVPSEDTDDSDLLAQYDTQTGDIFYMRAGDGEVLSLEEAGRILEQRRASAEEPDDEDSRAMDDAPGREEEELTDQGIGEQDQRLLRRWRELRTAAEAVAAALGRLPQVEKVALFGSVAKPLTREVPRFREYRRAGIELFHECKDVDLAVWVRDLELLRSLQKARSQTLHELLAQTEIGVAHHQVDIFLLEPVTDRYLGRLCCFTQCPKGKRKCRVEGCGAIALLQRHADFVFNWAAVSSDSIGLYPRSDSSGQENADHPPAR